MYLEAGVQLLVAAVSILEKSCSVHGGVYGGT
jgi:hypothetical protein